MRRLRSDWLELKPPPTLHELRELLSLQSPGYSLRWTTHFDSAPVCFCTEQQTGCLGPRCRLELALCATPFTLVARRTDRSSPSLSALLSLCSTDDSCSCTLVLKVFVGRSQMIVGLLSFVFFLSGIAARNCLLSDV